jgi:hypothetical protein
MLTGGASVVYARALAGDPRNAILLTGYQDEEAPGRFLQRMLKEREEGDEVSWKIDGKQVTLRCQLGTYSLSAHADEQELINIAEALNPDTIMLVHGDPGARHSLATGLRQRGRRTLTPRIGQTEVFKFAKRPWAMGQVRAGHETRTLDPAALWAALKDQAGSFFSGRELAQMWWGDAERGSETARLLQDSVHFAADWRRKDTFQVRTEQQVQRAQRQRAILLANPDLVGKLVILRDSNNRPRLGVVRDAGIDSFEAEVQNTKGRHYPGDALLWVIGAWSSYPAGNPEQKGIKTQLTDLLRDAKAQQDAILPFHRRQALAQAGQAITPEGLLPDTLPEGVTQAVALTAIVMALAGDGATLEPEGLRPRRALEHGSMEQNQAREIAFAAFPADARLHKVGMEVHRKRMTLTFDFPDRAGRLFAEEIDSLEEQTGWEVWVKPGVNQQALGSAVQELLDQHGGRLVKGPSFFMDRSEVSVEVSGVDDLSALQQDFRDLTGFRLVVSRPGESALDTAAVQPQRRDRLEINAAYGVLWDALEPFGLSRAGLKQDRIVLTFISPQVGERHMPLITELAEQTGYPLEIHPHPNQQQIMQVAQALLREAGWAIRKGPGLHTDRAEISVTLVNPPDEAEAAEIAERLEAQTGYRLVVSA